MYLNKVYILGNLTKDPELKSLPSGTKISQFTIATNRVYRDSNNVKHEAVEYHNIVTFGRQAELCAQYLKKGQSALVEGRIQTRSWDDTNGGGKKYRTEIIADNVQFGPKGNTGTSNNTNTEVFNDKADDIETIDYGEIVDPEDIPF